MDKATTGQAARAAKEGERMIRFQIAMLKVELRNRIDNVLMWFAWRLPRRLVMWCAIRLMAHATTGKYSTQVVPDLLAMDALQRWGD